MADDILPPQPVNPSPTVTTSDDNPRRKRPPQPEKKEKPELPPKPDDGKGTQIDEYV